MDRYTMETANGIFTPSVAALVIIIVFIAAYVAYTWYMGRNTVPVPSYIVGFADMPVPDAAPPGVVAGAIEASKFFENPAGSAEAKKAKELPDTSVKGILDVVTSEGFYGGAAVGTGSPDCLRSSSEGAELVAMFKTGSDQHELSQIVGKLGCFKKDLMSPSYIVDATRKQQFVTMHDIEPIAETTGRCFAKTISPRDMELAFDKWTQRGELLIKRLCAKERLEAETAEALFRAVIRDVKDIARSQCFTGEPTIAGKPGPRDPHPYENPDLEELGAYSGYY